MKQPISCFATACVRLQRQIRVALRACLLCVAVLVTICCFPPRQAPASEPFYHECLKTHVTHCECKGIENRCEKLVKEHAVRKHLVFDVNSWLVERPIGMYLCGQQLCHVELRDLRSLPDTQWTAWVSAAPAHPAAPTRKLGTRQRSFYVLAEACAYYPEYCDGSFLQSVGFTDLLSIKSIPNITSWPFSLLTWDLNAYAERRLPTHLKRKAAAVFISNCKIGNTHRMERIKFLQDHGIEVHSFGACMHTHDVDREFPACARQSRPNPSDDAVKLCVFRHYRFAITIENFYERGYVTEKLFHALLAGTVPIYYGHPSNSRYYPTQNAVITLSPRVNEEYIIQQIIVLMKNDELYDRALQWRNEVLHMSSNEHFVRLHDYSLSHLVCNICDIL